MSEPPSTVTQAILGDGRGLLHVVGLALVFSGCFAIFVALTRFFLPHDLVHIGFDADELARLNPQLVDFMFHNRAAWGGALIAVGIVWLWLVHFPLAVGNPYAWRILRISGIVGFSSFLAFIGYGYFDLWHGIATIALLPFFVVGLWRSRSLVRPLLPDPPADRLPRNGSAFLLWLYAAGLFVGGIAILIISVTTVYVPDDVKFMALCGADIDAFSRRLTPVIAHDRSSFGGSLCTLGMTLLLIYRHLPFNYPLWQTVGLTGLFGFGSALGIHYYIGYTTFTHLAPAWFGFAIFVIGIIRTKPPRSDATADQQPNL